MRVSHRAGAVGMEPAWHTLHTAIHRPPPRTA